MLLTVAAFWAKMRYNRDPLYPEHLSSEDCVEGRGLTRGPTPHFSTPVLLSWPKIKGTCRTRAAGNHGLRKLQAFHLLSPRQRRGLAVLDRQKKAVHKPTIPGGQPARRGVCLRFPRVPGSYSPLPGIRMPCLGDGDLLIAGNRSGGSSGEAASGSARFSAEPRPSAPFHLGFSRGRRD